MAIPKYLVALANHKGPATVNAGGMSIPVKIMDISHTSDLYSSDECTFKCMVVNEDQIKTDTSTAAERIAKQALNSIYGAHGPEYVRQALAKVAEARTHDEIIIGPVVKINPMKIKRVIFNNPATIVIWADGTKTVVKCQDGDVYSKETGLALCIAKKALGNTGSFNDVFRQWIPEDDTPIDNKPRVYTEAELNEAFEKLCKKLGVATRVLAGGDDNG